MHRIKAPIQTLSVKSGDGTLLKVFKCGNGPHLWLLPPGLGTPVLAWKYLFERFHKQMTIVTWDPRGCFGSERPVSMDRLRIVDHVDDAFAVIKALKWDGKTFVTGGWSLGVQLGLEIYNRAPNQIVGLTLINGACEHILKTSFNFIPAAETIIKGTLKGMITASPVITPLSSYLLGQDWVVKFLQSLSIVTENEEFFGQVAKEFKELDFGVYFNMMLQCNEHSATRVLADVNVPTLITCGTMDKMTPVSASQFMHEQIKDSELLIVENGTHYTTLEYPDIVNDRLEEFFRERVFKGTWN